MSEPRSRYFFAPHPELAARLEAHFDTVRARMAATPAVAANVEALVLGGGYGRGEGGVFVREDGSEELFNDLDYFLFARTPDDPALAALVREIECEGARDLGIDVDIKVQRLEAMAPPHESMMSYDLAARHVVVSGARDILERRWPRPDGSRLPMGEASRLLWNRGTGLYFAACEIARGAAGESRRRFVERNHAKFKLASGDALLCADGLYHWSLEERERRFARRDDRFGIAGVYAEGAEFKRSPRPGALAWDELAVENRELARLWERLFLHVEARRLGVEFADAEAYVVGRERRSPEVPRWKAPLFALRDVLRHRRWVAPVWDYPRAGLFRSLVCLLSDRLPAPRRFLGDVPGEGLGAWEDTYKFWWERYG